MWPEAPRAWHLCVKIIVHPSCFYAQKRGLAVLARVSDAHWIIRMAGRKSFRLSAKLFSFDPAPTAGPNGPMETIVFEGAVTAALALVLGWLAWIDMRTFRLPDLLTLPLVLAGLAVSALRVQGWPFEAGLGAAFGLWRLRAFGRDLLSDAVVVEGLGLGRCQAIGGSRERGSVGRRSRRSFCWRRCPRSARRSCAGRPNSPLAPIYAPRFSPAGFGCSLGPT